MCLRGLTQLHKYPGVPAACPEELEALRRVAGTRCSARTRRCTRPPACLCQVFPLYIAVLYSTRYFPRRPQNSVTPPTKLRFSPGQCTEMRSPTSGMRWRHAFFKGFWAARAGGGLRMVLLGFTCFLWALGTEFDRQWGSLATTNPSRKLLCTLAAAPRRAWQGCFSDAKWAVLASLG